MKFNFNGYMSPTGEETIEIKFNFMRYSRLAQVMEPTEDEVLYVDEYFERYKIDLFKDLLEKYELMIENKIKKEEMKKEKMEKYDEYKYLIKSSLMEDLMKYFQMNKLFYSFGNYEYCRLKIEETRYKLFYEGLGGEFIQEGIKREKTRIYYFESMDKLRLFVLLDYLRKHVLCSHKITESSHRNKKFFYIEPSRNTSNRCNELYLLYVKNLKFEYKDVKVIYNSEEIKIDKMDDLLEYEYNNIVFTEPEFDESYLDSIIHEHYVQKKIENIF